MKASEAAGRLSAQPDLARVLEEIRNESNEVSRATHDFSHKLHPAALLLLGLTPTLEAECATFSKQYGITINFSAENVPESVPEEAALCLYRVAQESLENIRKHSQAKTASVTLAGRGQELVMVIQDFGRGFDLEAARRGGGLGLVSMEGRVRLGNGKLIMSSKRGEGTRNEVRIPIGRF